MTDNIKKYNITIDEMQSKTNISNTMLYIINKTFNLEQYKDIDGALMYCDQDIELYKNIYELKKEPYVKDTDIKIFLQLKNGQTYSNITVKQFLQDVKTHTTHKYFETINNQEVSATNQSPEILMEQFFNKFSKGIENKIEEMKNQNKTQHKESMESINSISNENKELKEEVLELKTETNKLQSQLKESKNHLENTINTVAIEIREQNKLLLEAEKRDKESELKLADLREKFNKAQEEKQQSKGFFKNLFGKNK